MKPIKKSDNIPWMSRADFLKAKADEEREFAHNYSLNRTESDVPLITNSITEEEFNKRQALKIAQLEKDLAEAPIDRKNTALWNLDTEKNRVYLPYLTGWDCAYTSTGNYSQRGINRRCSGNLTFASNPQKYGFVPITKDQLRPGDLVQTPGKGHMMTFDSYSDDGTPLYNYSNGNNNIRIKKPYLMYDGGLYYTFVGTPEDLWRWTGEWLNKYMPIETSPLGISLNKDNLNLPLTVVPLNIEMKKKLIKRHQQGGLVNQQYSGTWGNRGQGNELQSALENGLSGIWNGVKWIGDKVLKADEYIEDGLAYMVGMLPGKGMNSEQMVATQRAKREAQPGEVYYDALGNSYIKPHTGVVPVLPTLPAGAPSSLIKLHDNMKKLRSSWAVRESQLKKLGKLDDMPKTLTARRYKEAEKTFNDAVESIGKATHNTDPTKLTKRLKSSFKAEKARSTNDLRAANVGRPSERDFDYMENIARNDKHPVVQKLLHQYDLKVAKGMDPALARQRRKEMLLEFAKFRNYSLFVTKHTK